MQRECGARAVHPHLLQAGGGAGRGGAPNQGWKGSLHATPKLVRRGGSAKQNCLPRRQGREERGVHMLRVNQSGRGHRAAEANERWERKK